MDAEFDIRNPPACEESSDAVTYRLYEWTWALPERDGRPPTAAALHAARLECLYIASRYTQGYLWNDQPFRLRVGSHGGVPCLEGRTRFGDALDDEWFIVWLVRSHHTSLGSRPRTRSADSG